MGVFKSVIEFLKGVNHAEGTEKRVSGGDGCERRILHSLPSIREQIISDIGGIRMLATACAAERSRNPGEMPPDPVCRESRALIVAAKKTGCLISPDEIPGTRYTIRTGESEVRIVQKDRVYYKIKNPFAKLHLKKHSAEYVLFEHVIHNAFFPDCRLDFLGIAEDLHEARLVYRQKAIRADARPDDKQIAESLSLLGLLPDGRYSFGNDFVFVTDVGQDGDNVLLDDDNNLRFIDPIIGFKQPLQDCLAEVLSPDFDVDGFVSEIFDLSGAKDASLTENMVKQF